MSSFVSPSKSAVKSHPAPGSVISKPALESYLLISEKLAQAAAPNVLRVLDHFVFFRNGKPVPLSSDILQMQSWSGVTVVGLAASLVGRGSTFAQCGWLQRTQCLWFMIKNIRRLEAKADQRFRCGEMRMWMTSAVGEYVLLDPNPAYLKFCRGAFETTCRVIHCPMFQRIPLNASPPAWWNDTTEDKWPEIDSSTIVSNSKRVREEGDEEKSKRPRLAHSGGVLESDTATSSQPVLRTTASQRGTWVIGQPKPKMTRSSESSNDRVQS